MIIVYKAGGDWKTPGGKSYTAKPVNKLSEAGEGYSTTLEQALKAKVKKSAKPKTEDLLGE
tara:strand:- start:341 stop:523 length:183 start_codon:yes stop_codon:yes gene_type:complete